jgi:probable HAF family extracellular repeat protein
MRRRNSMVPTVIVAVLAAACNDDPAGTGPSAPSHHAAATAATYTIKNLGTLGGNQSRASAINNVGQIAGWSRTTSGQAHAFLYHAGKMQDLGALAGGLSEASDLNDAGVVVGYSTLLSGAERAVRWQAGMRRNLGTLGGRNSRATGINEDGVIVGWSETTSGDRHAFVWKNGVMTDIGTLGGKLSIATGINKAGRVVGWGTTASGGRHAFAWNGKFQDLGDNGTLFGAASAINSGRIVGSFGPPPDAEGGELELITPFVFSGGVATVFFTRQISSLANDVNPDGIIVGYDENVRSDDADADAWVRQSDGTLQYLPELADGNAAAWGINKFGTIVGSSAASDGWPKAVIWRRQ